MVCLDHNCVLRLFVRAQGLKLALEQSRIGLMKGSMPKLDNPDANWSFMKGTKVAAADARCVLFMRACVCTGVMKRKQQSSKVNTRSHSKTLFYVHT